MMNSLTNMRSLIQATLALVAVLQVQACTMGGQFLKEANTTTDVTKDDIIIVGTIELAPELAEDEQSLNPSGVIMIGDVNKLYKNRAMIQFNNQPHVSDYKSVITPELGKTFFYSVPSDMLYMVEGSVIMELSTRGVSGKIILPTWFKIDAKPGDKAVYIGKILYKRDDFNSITDMKLVDDYKNASRQFKNKFGSQYKLKKSLAKQMPPS